VSVYLIDGYNLLHEVLRQQGSGSDRLLASEDLDRERNRLVDHIASFMGGTSDRAIVVFDARGEALQKVETATAQMEVYFGSFTRSADSIIESEVFRLTPGENVIVVSSDYNLQKTVFRPDVLRRSSRQFATDLQNNTKKIANSQNCITMSHRIEDRVPANTLDRLTRLRDELRQDAPNEDDSEDSGRGPVSGP